MAVRATLTGFDYSKESTRSGFYMVDFTAANFDAQVAALASIQASVQGVTLIGYEGRTVPADFVGREQIPPTDKAAQRENKWLITYVDNVNNRTGTIEIGGADTSLLVNNTDLADLTTGPFLTLVTALQADAVSRDGNPITVIEARYVGRNL